MSDKVHELKVAPRLRGGEPQPAVIEYVEHLLALAKTGEMQSIAVSFATAGGHPTDGWTLGDRDCDVFLVCAGLVSLQHRLAVSMNAPANCEQTYPPTDKT